MAVKNKHEIKITRVYNASVKDVWEAWVDPNKAAKWWGPRGFSITTHAKDFRPGGFWEYTMHGPDGTDWPNKTHYLEIEKHSRLVYDHGGSADRPPLFRVTVNFSESKGKTTMEMSMAVETPEALENIKKTIKQASGNSTWDRLAEYLEHEATGKENFVINRTFDTPIETMYEVWTNPKHFAKWLPPTGFRMEFIRADIRPGGSTFYFMTNDNGVTMYGSTEYLEFNKPNRIVYKQDFRTKDEKISRHPFAPLWPETMLTTVTLSAEGPNQTRVTVNWEPYGTFTAAEVAEFVKAKAGMTQGWTGSFDKLEAYLETV